MKKIVLALLGALMLIGFAAAWDSTDNLYYSYTKDAYIQGGDPVPALIGTTSGTWFEAPNGDCPTNAQYDVLPWTTDANVANKLLDAEGNLKPFMGTAQSGHATLTQQGAASATIRAPDLADGKPEMQGSFSTLQNLHFGPAVFMPGLNGLGTRANEIMVWADFASEGAVRADSIAVASGTEREDSSLVNGYDGVLAIEGTSGTTISGADLRLSSTTGFTRDMAQNGAAIDLVSASTTAYAGFTGGSLAQGDSNYIQTNTGAYETTVAIKTDGTDWTENGQWVGFGNAPLYPDW